MIRLAVRVDRAQADLVLAELLELAPAGVEEVTVDEHTVEYAVYGAAGELPSLPDLTSAAGTALVGVSTSETPDDWHERWKTFHRPVTIQAPDGAPQARSQPRPSLHVRAPWQAPRVAEDVLDIAIDPGQAFGTGAHDTTRLCLSLMLELTGSEGSAMGLLDVGTGSGVLAIAAARLGFSPVLGLDSDRESVLAARANALANGAAIEVRRLDARHEQLPWIDHARRAASGLVVVANLLRPLLLELARTISRAPEHLVLGGLLAGEVGEVADAFVQRLGMCERARRSSREWAAVWLSAGPAEHR